MKPDHDRVNSVSRSTRLFPMLGLAIAFWAGLTSLPSRADWPMLRQGPGHSGHVEAEIKPPYHLAWARQIERERLGTAMEPILADERLFVSTHAGRVYALDAVTGEGLWCYQANSAFLHSPAVAEGRVLAAASDGWIYALSVQTGKADWIYKDAHGGFSASPVADAGKLYIGSRAGRMLAIQIQSGTLAWSQDMDVPIRQTAAVVDEQVIVTGEDLRVRSFHAKSGQLLWTSKPLPGQTARDYYPVIVKQTGGVRVVIRTNPLLNMGQRIGQDRGLLCRNAGIDDSSWQKLDAWIKSGEARGDVTLWAKEQKAIQDYLAAHRDAQSFFVLDGQTGQETAIAPVLWIAGCQGVGVEPALAADGRLLVFYRSAYGNWNHGVAPLVALGLLDLEGSQIAPLFHQQGRQPPWNCFWGTADESQNFLVAGNTVLIIHQGTLSGFRLDKSELFPIWGERDTYGGFRNPSWARNEWHGPARSSVALDHDRIYWQTGSRILCLAPGAPDKSKAAPQPLSLSTNILSHSAPASVDPNPSAWREKMGGLVEEIISTNWAPMFVDPGLAGREFSFDHSGEFLEALAWACPHLKPEQQNKVKSRLREEWRQHPPFTRQAWYSLREGARREWFSVPLEYCARLGTDPQPLPFGNLGIAWFYAQRCGEETLVIEQWPRLKAAYEEFAASQWKLGEKGNLFANRYLASLLAFHQIALRCKDTELAQKARTQADQISEALVAWWKRAAAQGTLQSFNTASELDPFIGKGDGISLAIAPHRHKIALFLDLTPEIANLVRAKAPEAIEQVWQTFTAMCPTWAQQGEERQIHFGENFVDPPRFAMGAFKALAWLRKASAEELDRSVDIPFCRADLYYLTKLALVLEAEKR